MQLYSNPKAVLSLCATLGSAWIHFLR